MDKLFRTLHADILQALFLKEEALPYKLTILDAAPESGCGPPKPYMFLGDSKETNPEISIFFSISVLSETGSQTETKEILAWIDRVLGNSKLNTEPYALRMEEASVKQSQMYLMQKEYKGFLAYSIFSVR